MQEIISITTPWYKGSKYDWQMKILSNSDNSKPTYNLLADIAQKIWYSNSTPKLSPTSKFPLNMVNPTQENIYDHANGRFLENQIENQNHTFRIQISYSGKNVNEDCDLEFRIYNPNSWFELVDNASLAKKSTSGKATFLLDVYADSFSLKSPLWTWNGYELWIKSSENINIVIDWVTVIYRAVSFFW